MAREKFDDYPTKEWPVRRLLEYTTFPTVGARWIEPCAGGGNIIRHTNNYLINAKEGLPRWDACEIQKKYKKDLDQFDLQRVRIGNFMTAGSWLTKPRWWKPKTANITKGRWGHGNRPYAVAISNPPFKRAVDVIRACVPVSWYTVMLLRLNFLASEERDEFFKEVGMPNTLILPNRPSFKGLRPTDTDSQEYAWMIWPPGKPRKTGTVTRLPLTSYEERVTGRTPRHVKIKVRGRLKR